MNILNKIVNEFGTWVIYFLSYFPGSLGWHLRYIAYRARFKSCGKNVRVLPHVSIKGFKNIELADNICIYPYSTLFAESKTGEAKIKIGSNVGLNHNVMVNADIKGEIVIEDNVLVGPNVVMRASGHKYADINVPIRKQGHHKGKIVIKEGGWIGANAVILPDVTLGRGAIIGAGAVVTKDVDDFDIVGGVPAKKIKSRLETSPVV